jgi:hypothetical protein
MKIYTFLLVLFVGIISFENSFAQGFVGVLDNDILYRGIENQLKLGSMHGDSTLVLFSENAVIRKHKNEWLVLPDTSTKIELCVVNSSKDTLSRWRFKVLPLPELYLFWGSTVENEKCYLRTANTLDLRYKNYITLQSPEIVIQNWEMTIDGCPIVFKGNGNKFTPDVIEILQFAPSRTRATVTVDYKYPGISSLKRKTSMFIL